MAYTAGNLHLRAGAPGDLTYTYDAGSDTLATVFGAGYFNNSDDDLNLTADDLIFVQASDGNAWARVSAIQNSAAVLHFAGGNLPVNTFATGTAAALNTLSLGYYEVGTSIATASRSVLPTPYPGAEVKLVKVDSGSQLFSFDAGASASDISDGGTDASGGGTGVTYDSVGNRRIVLQTEGDMAHLRGSSTSRWRIEGMNINASAVAPSGGSVFLQGT